MPSTDPVNAIETAAQEARADARWLAAHGYHEASVWHFGTALTDYGPESRRTAYAVGYAVKYAGRLRRDDGTEAEYPSAGITVYCQPGQLPLDKLVKAGRALVTFGAGDHREYGPYTAYYVAGYNPRDTELRRDQSVNPGIVPKAHLHELTAMIGGDGPKRFYDLRLDPAGELLPGDRVRVIIGDGRVLAAGVTGTVRTGMSLISGELHLTIETDSGRYRTVLVSALEPAGDG